MVKKRVRDPESLPEAPAASINENEDSGSDDDVDMVNVDFEWFNMKPDVDFHGIKTLLRQLFDVDAQLFDLSALTDLILSQPTIGSTVKVDGEDTDAYAFMTVLNVHEHQQKPIIAGLTNYILEKTRTTPALSSLPSLLSSSSAQVGLILTERLINIPTEVQPPMYTMLMDEVESAVDDKEPYEFTHYLIVSKTYSEVTSSLDQEDAPRTKKNKAGKAKETFYFHPEDEILQRHALGYGGYEYTKDEGDAKADSKRAFQELGIKPQGSVMLVEAAKLEGAVKAVDSYIGGQQ
ncbi:MAG: Mss4p nuclear export [Claussenomyces sp. TS43310]|nr:MAG: Mss4p nuclear export [Claussenomyces sp. TS43310]